jgi:hypothetical protein
MNNADTVTTTATTATPEEPVQYAGMVEERVRQLRIHPFNANPRVYSGRLPVGEVHGEALLPLAEPLALYKELIASLDGSLGADPLSDDLRGELLGPILVAAGLRPGVLIGKRDDTELPGWNDAVDRITRATDDAYFKRKGKKEDDARLVTARFSNGNILFARSRADARRGEHEAALAELVNGEMGGTAWERSLGIVLGFPEPGANRALGRVRYTVQFYMASATGPYVGLEGSVCTRVPSDEWMHARLATYLTIAVALGMLDLSCEVVKRTYLFPDAESMAAFFGREPEQGRATNAEGRG